MTRLILIRHGKTEWNLERRLEGRSDPPLNGEGIAQAQRMATELKNAGIDAIYTSPLRRAYQTAQILAWAVDVRLEVEPRLTEVDQGEWQGRLRSEIERATPDLLHRWETAPWSTRPPGGESLKEVQRRVAEALDEILGQKRHVCVALVSHRYPIALIKALSEGLGSAAVPRLSCPTPVGTRYRSINGRCGSADSGTVCSELTLCRVTVTNREFENLEVVLLRRTKER